MEHKALKKYYPETLFEEFLPNIIREYGIRLTLSMIEDIVVGGEEMEPYDEKEYFDWCEETAFQRLGYKKVD